MAKRASSSSSSSALQIIAEDDELILDGSESGWVEARTHCDHLASLSSDLIHIPTPDTPCNRMACNGSVVSHGKQKIECVARASPTVQRLVEVRSEESVVEALDRKSLVNFSFGCQHPAENWLCLCCKDVLCSRFVNKHMLEHYQQEHHNLALSFSDLSVWCFSCDAYLDAQVILPLRPAYETAYILKFGSPPPFRTIENLPTVDKEANASTGE